MGLPKSHKTVATSSSYRSVWPLVGNRWHIQSGWSEESSYHDTGASSIGVLHPLLDLKNEEKEWRRRQSAPWRRQLGINLKPRDSPTHTILWEENTDAHLILLSHSSPTNTPCGQMQPEVRKQGCLSAQVRLLGLTEQVRKGWSGSGEVNGSYSAKWLPILTRISQRQDPTSARTPFANLSAQRLSTHQARPCLRYPVLAAFSAQNAFTPNTGITCPLTYFRSQPKHHISSSFLYHHHI